MTCEGVRKSEEFATLYLFESETKLTLHIFHFGFFFFWGNLKMIADESDADWLVGWKTIKKLFAVQLEPEGGEWWEKIVFEIIEGKGFKLQVKKVKKIK